MTRPIASLGGWHLRVGNGGITPAFFEVGMWLHALERFDVRWYHDNEEWYAAYEQAWAIREGLADPVEFDETRGKR